MESTEEPKTATADNQAPQADPMALSIGDLKNLQGILDVASKRGAFGASEMAGVGFIGQNSFFELLCSGLAVSKFQEDLLINMNF